MSFLSGLGKILGVAGGAIAAPFTGGASLATVLPAVLGAGGAAVGAMANSSAQNRDARFSGQMDLAQLMMQRDLALQQLRASADNDYTSNQIARENSGMATREDAWRKLLSAQHTLNPRQMPNITPYAAAQRQPTDAEKQGADALTAEVMQRLQGGNPIAAIEKRNPTLDPINVDPKLLQPGRLERFGGILAPVLGMAGAMGQAGAGSVLGRRGGPIGPQLTTTDLAFLRTQNPRMVA